MNFADNPWWVTGRTRARSDMFSLWELCKQRIDLPFIPRVSISYAFLR